MSIAAYLDKWTRLHYSRFEPEWIPDALAQWGAARELFLSDLQCKYSAISTDAISEADVCDLIETDTTIEAALYYRLLRSIFLRAPQHPSLRYLAHLMKAKTAMEIYYSTDIGPRLRIEHGVGIVIGPRYRIGPDFTVHQGVTLGQRRLFSPNETITIGSNCTIFAGAKILGTIRIGDNVRIAANAVLLSDAEENSTYAGIPAVKVGTGKSA